MVFLFHLFPDSWLPWGRVAMPLTSPLMPVPQGNQELLVVKDEVGKPPGELRVSKSTKCDIFPFSTLTLLVGRQQGNSTCKMFGVSLLVAKIWLKLLHDLSLPLPSSLASIKLANTGSPGKMAVKMERKRLRFIPRRCIHSGKVINSPPPWHSSTRSSSDKPSVPSASITVQHFTQSTLSLHSTC